MASIDLKGKKVVLTGTFVTMKRDEAEKRLAEAGVTISGSVSKTTDVLICGENAGSKLAKATSLGVAQMTEAEMVAWLVQGGKGGDLAGAQETLAKASAAGKAESAIAGAVSELRVFVETLRRRPDVRVTVASVGRRATKGEVAMLKRQEGIPEELIDMYAAMNGAHVEWEFVEPPGGGCLRIPPVTQWTRFDGDDRTYMGFGDDCEALLLDEVRAEGGTWLVREKGSRSARIVFASAAEGSDGIEPAASIAEYLRAAVASGFVYYWPRCFRDNPRVSYAEQEAAVERFRAVPERPSPIVVGGRVQFACFAEGGRGVVLAQHEAPPVREAEFCGRNLAQVRLDEGSVAWLPEKWMKAIKGSDAYERLRSPGFDLRAAAREDVSGLLADVARAVGPMEHLSTANVGTIPSNARRAAGLLSARPFSEAVALVIDLHGAAREARLDFGERRALAKSGQEFSATDFARHGFEHTIEGTFTGLFGGLLLLACHESARRGVAGRDLPDPALRDRVPEVSAAQSFKAALAEAEVLSAPSWHHDSGGEPARALGLPAGAVLLQGSGF